MANQDILWQMLILQTPGNSFPFFLLASQLESIKEKQSVDSAYFDTSVLKWIVHSFKRCLLSALGALWKPGGGGEWKNPRKGIYQMETSLTDQDSQVLIPVLSQIGCRSFNFSVCFSRNKIVLNNHIPFKSKIFFYYLL